MSQVSQSHDKSHDGYGKTVHRPCSRCINSVLTQDHKELRVYPR